MPGSLSALSRVLNIYRTTSHHISICNALERRYGALPRHVLHGLMSRWAKSVLRCAKVELDCQGEVVRDRPVLYVGNHVSYLDIPLVMAFTPTVFVAKAELGKWPVIGSGCRRTGTVLVDRSSFGSRREAAKAIGRTIVDQGQSVTVFPSGTTTISEEVPWRQGAFEMARQFSFEVQPFVISYDPLRPAAYIDKDVFLPHMWRLFEESRIEATIRFLPPRRVQSPKEDCDAILQEVRGHMQNPGKRKENLRLDPRVEL